MSHLHSLGESLISNQVRIESPFLNQGICLDAMVLFEVGIISGDVRFCVAANQRLQLALLKLDDFALSTSLYRGVTGVGWLIKCYRSQCLNNLESEFLVDLDSHICDGIENVKNVAIDVVDGLAGLIIYATQSINNFTSPASRAVCDHLAIATSDCLVRYLDDDNACNPKSAYRNLGFAHGITGILGVAPLLLSSVKSSGNLRHLITNAAKKLWDERLQFNELVDFASTTNDSTPARLAWCYGILGISVAYTSIARVDEGFRRHAQELLDSCVIKLNSPNHGINDSSLCHGFSGLYLLLKGVLLEGSYKINNIDMKSIKERVLADISRDSNGCPYTKPIIGGQSMRFNSFLEGVSGTVLAVEANSSSYRRWTVLLGQSLQ